MAKFAHLVGFRDFDDKIVYDGAEKALRQVESRNFVIEFDDEGASIAQDIEEKPLSEFLRTIQPTNSSTRWINIFGPERQKDLMKELSSRYKFTPRLLGLMCSDHKTPVPIPSSPAQNDPVQGKTQIATESGSVESTSSDLEKNEGGVSELIHHRKPDMSHYKLVDEVWHYSSVDWGAKYICIGYNLLTDTHGMCRQSSSESEDGTSQGKGHPSNKPKGARTWTWLVLCDDGTVISVYETPFSGEGTIQSGDQSEVLYDIRYNLRNVFSQLSRVKNHGDNPRIETLEIRPGISTNQSSPLKISDSPSLLFYYLFDDWYTTYALVAKDQYQYARQLEKLRGLMFTRPEVTLINQLHQYGRELAVLKRMYQSYAHIIERILGRQRSISEAAAGVPSSSEGNLVAENQTLGVPMASAATARFERLLDRINHLALNEIQECLDEKESLVFLNFNLLTMKESHAVERLTRITILLAKVTILFMPVSLMTSYFSTQLSDIANKYTIKTYWICFAVIMILSFLFLVVFGAVSGTLEGKPVYRSLTRTIWDNAKVKRGDRKKLRNDQKETR